MESTQLKNIEVIVGELRRTVLDRCVTSSPTADVILSIVPMVAVVFGSVLLFFLLLYNYRLRKEKIRQQIPTESALEHLRFISLLAGCLSFSAGFPLALFFVFTNPANPGILGGLIPLFAGIGLIVFFYLTQRKTGKTESGQSKSRVHGSPQDGIRAGTSPDASGHNAEP